MNLPIDTCENGACASTLRCGYPAAVYPVNIGKGGIIPRHPCAWCINASSDGAAATITLHYHKECWSNILGGGSSLMLATAVMTIWEV